MTFVSRWDPRRFIVGPSPFLACLALFVPVLAGKALQVTADRMSGPQGRQVQVRVFVSEVSVKNFDAFGVTWGKVQPAPGEQLNIARTPSAGGSLSALLTAADAERLRTLFPAADTERDIYVTDDRGIDVVKLLGASLGALRARANKRSLVIMSAPKIIILDEPFTRRKPAWRS